MSNELDADLKYWLAFDGVDGLGLKGWERLEGTLRNDAGGLERHARGAGQRRDDAQGPGLFETTPDEPPP